MVQDSIINETREKIVIVGVVLAKVVQIETVGPASEDNKSREGGEDGVEIEKLHIGDCIKCDFPEK